ncbi:P-loop ATPase, Sll1717 family [Tomitella gaofuii]|uniref:P-loop ATPase, Sll1717 family n=1 Tax=Tomitella gaofuii TaxID=2760083 RepID=UPI0015FBE35A|nr:hypothetical protein [Tomitella gaofuii]
MAIRDIKSLYFGEASAEKEVSQNAERFFDTYLDVWDLAERAKANKFFLILGPKGAGKTAAGNYIRFSLERLYGKSQVLSTSRNMDELSPNISQLTALTSKLVSQNTQGITTDAWKLFIGVQLALLVKADSSSELGRYPEFIDLMRELEEAGLVAGDFPKVLRTVRENRLSFSARFLSHDSTKRKSDEISVSVLGGRLIERIISSQTDAHYLLMIDGLDRVIADNDAYWLSLASLLMAASDIHNRILAESAPIHLFVMCRSDVFRKVKFADADKIVGDSTIFIDWANQQTRVEDNHLWDYIAKKAEIQVSDIFDALPSYVEVGRRSNKGPKRIKPVDYLYSSTRATPREMTMLMRQLQEVVPRGGGITSDRLRKAVDNFASRDLLSILNAESAGILSEVMRSRLSGVIGGLPRATSITKLDLEQSLRENDLDAGGAEGLAEYLFMAGLLGNYNAQTGYVQFYYRRDTYAFRRSGPWILHRGLAYAYNVPW